MSPETRWERCNPLPAASATTTFSSSLKLANTYQASIYFLEQQLGPYLVRSGLVYNQLRDIAGTINSGRPLTAFTVAATPFYAPNSANVASTSSAGAYALESADSSADRPQRVREPAGK